MPRPEDSPWAIPVAQLSSRAGQYTDIDMVFPAPSGIGDSVVGVREGADVRVTGSLDSIVDGLVLSACIGTRLEAACTRCLTPITRDWQSNATVFFPYHSPDKANHGGHANHDDEEEVDIIAGEDESEDIYPLSPDGGFADVEALLRDTFAEHLPLQLLCRKDCRGLCPQCGINLNEHPDHHHEFTDPRFAELADLKSRLEQEHRES